jgi:FKBP-type peptidyl-prolyl cis-trans isomerase
MRMNRFVVPLLVLLALASCNNDDGPDVDIVPPRLLSEVTTENDTEIRTYLQTHFYNYEEFANPPADFDFKIRIDTLAGENSGKTPLINQVQAKTLKVSSSAFGLDVVETDINHNYYYLIAKEGMGEKPTVGDSTFVKYEGSFLNGNLFDSQASFTWQYPPFFLRGYSDGIANFKVGGNIIVNEDGTTAIEGSGVGMIILPSGLAYFNSTGTSGTIPRYSVLIFKIETGLFIENTDYDNDGIPSSMEDLNGDGNLNNDNTDLDDEIEQRLQAAVPNHLDADDDGDGTPTRDEIIINPDGTLTFPDLNSNGIPDYLDNTYPN